MKKQTKIIAGIGVLALGGLLVATQVSGNSEDFQGRFSVKQNAVGQQMSTKKTKKTAPAVSNTLAVTDFKMPETAASKTVDEMLIEVPALIKAADGLLDDSNSSSDSITNTLERVVTSLDSGDGSGALSLLDSAESELSTLENKIRNLETREDKLQDYNDVLEQYLEEDWPNLIELIEDNLDQAATDLQTATREAFNKKMELSRVTQELNTVYAEYSEIYLKLREAETHRDMAISEKANFEDGVDTFQEMEADNDISKDDMYAAIENMIHSGIPVLRIYYPGIKDDDDLYPYSRGGQEEIGNVVTGVIPNKYYDLINEDLPATIQQLSVQESLKDRAVTAKENERREVMDELEELEAEIERLTEALSADTSQGQTAAHAMMNEIQEAMMNGIYLTNLLADYFEDSNSAELASYKSSHEEMIDTYRSLAEQLQALE